MVYAVVVLGFVWAGPGGCDCMPLPAQDMELGRTAGTGGNACRVAAGVPHGLGTCSTAGAGDINSVNALAQEAAPWSPAAQPALAVALREQLDEYRTLWESLGGRAPPALGPAPAVPDGQTCRDYHPECAQWAAQARCLSL